MDYYTRTTFEIVHGSLGAQNSVLGGGRYDGLAEALGSNIPSPGIGFSIGEDRLVMSVEEQHAGADAIELFIAPLGQEEFRHSAILARELRKTGAVVEVAGESKLKKAMETANKLNARRVLILGENEMRAGQYTLKDMATGEQQLVTRQELIQIWQTR
ncbi:MAG: His/Gly/Thr/Pro-type tRNA ligase C-terminal domain-containing protein [Bryobacteraceae bacterium]